MDKLDILENQMKKNKINGYVLRNTDNSPVTTTLSKIKRMERLNQEYEQQQDALTIKNNLKIGNLVSVVKGPLNGLRGTVCNTDARFAYIFLPVKGRGIVELPVLYTDVVKKQSKLTKNKAV
jgi:transcription antitermination factor NusG